MSELEPACPPAGWYPDSTGRQRWWDGARWGNYAPVVAPFAYDSGAGPSPLRAYAEPLIVQVRPVKDVGIAYLFAILLGGFGAHRLYLGRIGSGITLAILYVIGWGLSLTVIGALLGIPLLIAVVVWLIVDLFLIPSIVREVNARGLPGR